MGMSTTLRAMFDLASLKPGVTALACIVVLLTTYIFYQRFWHPLARYSGPFLASLTDLWQVNQWLTRQQPYHLTELHAKYGPIVRYGPEKLSVTSKDLVQTIYVRGHKTMPKTAYYDAFGQPNEPNLFNQRDQAAHAVRRRVLLRAFAPQAVETYEPVIDIHINRMIEKIKEYCKAKQSFDLKETIYHFMCDAIGDLLYGEDLGIQKGGPVDVLPDDHDIAAWGSAIGSWPAMQPLLSLIHLLTPHPRARKSFRTMLGYFLQAKKIVGGHMAEMSAGTYPDRKDILSRIVSLKDIDPENKISQSSLTAEIFAFIIAGVHPPSATLGTLFYHLLHNKDVMEKAVAEIDAELPSSASMDSPYSGSVVEQNLSYLRNCVKENFRITPVFTMPLARKVTEGTFLDGQLIPAGTSVAVCNHAFHHNPDIWGNDHNYFRPARWEDEEYNQLGKLLMHFGAGGRQCIGKSLALTIIYKSTTTILAKFSFQLADPKEQEDVDSGLFQGKLPEQSSDGISDLKGSMMVKATERI